MRRMRYYQRLRGAITPRRLLLGLLVLLVAAGGLWLLRASGAALSPTTIRELLRSLGLWGPLLLVFWLAAILVVPIVPASVLQLGAGLAFGPWLGLALVLLADLLGASTGFLLARRWGTAALSRLLPADAVAATERLAGRMQWRGVVLLRLLPGPAYPLVSFAAGLSTLGFWHYTLASLLGVLPALALLVFAGDLVTSSPLLASALVVALVGSLALAGMLLRGSARQ